MAKPRSGAKKATPRAKKVRKAKLAPRKKGAARRVAKAKAAKKAARGTPSKRAARRAAKVRSSRTARSAAPRSRKAAERLKARSSKKQKQPARAKAQKAGKPKLKSARQVRAEKARAKAERLKELKQLKAEKARAKAERRKELKAEKKAQAEERQRLKALKAEKARAKADKERLKAEKARAKAEKAEQLQAERERAKAEKAAQKEQAKRAKLEAARAEKLKAAASKAKVATAQVSLPLGFPQSERMRPRATRLPPPGEPLNKRDMEQLLTAGQGRGVVGEGSLKGRLLVNEGMPYLVVLGRDKRELSFLLQGPDQEVLPAYVDHKVSVSGLIRKTTNYGGTVDVRKFSAKKPEAEVEEVPPETEVRLRYMSPGEVSKIMAPGMGAGMKGFASLRGHLEMTGEEFVLVLSNAGTRQQVSFVLEGEGAKGLRRFLGHTLQVTGVVDKSSGWGGRINVENVEPRPAESRPLSRDTMELTLVESEQPASLEVKLNQGLIVRLQEPTGFTWAIEPTVSKRLVLREVNFEPGTEEVLARREFFFTPRNPGPHEVEFFLAKAFNPGQVERSFKLNVMVKA